MSDIGQAETPMSDHIARFWKYLATETVRVLVDLRREVGTDAPDGPVVYWDGASFSDDVAKAIVADRMDMLEALQGVVAVADRKTVEFDRARAAIAKAKGRSNGT
jgi:hypothetical protein